MADERGHVVILGATSAMARGAANAFARRGYNLVLAARDEDEAGRLAADLRVRHGVGATALCFDALDFGGHSAFVQRCVQAADGTLAGVAFFSGYMADQKSAQECTDVARRTVDINLTAAMSLLERFAAQFEAQQSGFIAGVSSVAGDRGRQSNYIYGAAKAGFSAYLQGLRNRLHGAGVQVTTIKPGFVDTRMTWGLPGLFLVASPQTAGEAIVKAVEKRKDTAYVPWFWRCIMAIIRLVPEWQFKRMKL